MNLNFCVGSLKAPVEGIRTSLKGHYFELAFDTLFGMSSSRVDGEIFLPGDRSFRGSRGFGQGSPRRSTYLLGT